VCTDRLICSSRHPIKESLALRPVHLETLSTPFVMNRSELWCERTTTVRTKNLGAWRECFLSDESAGDYGNTEILASELRVLDCGL
jgi:hypothetical protein